MAICVWSLRLSTHTFSDRRGGMGQELGQGACRSSSRSSLAGQLVEGWRRPWSIFGGLPSASSLRHAFSISTPGKSPRFQSVCRASATSLIPSWGPSALPSSSPSRWSAVRGLHGQGGRCLCWAFPKSAGSSGEGPGPTLASLCRALLWLPLLAGVARWRPWVLVSGTGSGPPVPGLPGTGPSPAPLQSPSYYSPLLPLLALCSWCRRCAGRGKRLGSGSSPALATR